MEIEFYLNQRLDEKKRLTFHLRIFDKFLQLSLSLKFAKAELQCVTLIPGQSPFYDIIRG